jgi:hypothetical protein
LVGFSGATGLGASSLFPPFPPPSTGALPPLPFPFPAVGWGVEKVEEEEEEEDEGWVLLPIWCLGPLPTCEEEESDR